MAVLALAAGCSLRGHPSEGQRPTAPCPVTLPNGRSFVTPFRPEPQGNHGNNEGTLFTDLWPDGTVVLRPGGPGERRPDGSLAVKWPWLRNGVAGRIRVSGRRLDGEAPAPHAEFAGGGGEHGFTPSELVFSGAGCWEITARVGPSTLTFVTRVVRIDTDERATAGSIDGASAPLPRAAGRYTSVMAWEATVGRGARAPGSAEVAGSASGSVGRAGQASGREYLPGEQGRGG